MLSYALNVVDEDAVEVRNFNGEWPMPCKTAMQNHYKAANAKEQQSKKAADCINNVTI
jgi:hypothetical protein